MGEEHADPEEAPPGGNVGRRTCCRCCRETGAPEARPPHARIRGRLPAVRFEAEAVRPGRSPPLILSSIVDNMTCTDLDTTCHSSACDLRRTVEADGHILTESVSCSAADEMALFLNDVRSVQQLDDQVSKRFCTIHFFTSREGGLQALESVLDVQGDVTFLISEVRSDKAPRYYEGGSSSEPRRMVPLNTKIGPPAQLRRTPPPQVVQPIPIVASPPQTLSSPSPLSVLSLPPSSNLKMSAFTKVCETCGKSRSPEWRKGPSGEKTLCNACGLRYSRSLKKKEGQQSSSNK